MKEESEVAGERGSGLFLSTGSTRPVVCGSQGAAPCVVRSW